jgi:hypothetical protein
METSSILSTHRRNILISFRNENADMSVHSFSLHDEARIDNEIFGNKWIEGRISQNILHLHLILG